MRAIWGFTQPLIKRAPANRFVSRSKSAFDGCSEKSAIVIIDSCWDTDRLAFWEINSSARKLVLHFHHSSMSFPWSADKVQSTLKWCWQSPHASGPILLSRGLGVSINSNLLARAHRLADESGSVDLKQTLGGVCFFRGKELLRNQNASGAVAMFSQAFDLCNEEVMAYCICNCLRAAKLLVDLNVQGLVCDKGCCLFGSFAHIQLLVDITTHCNFGNRRIPLMMMYAKTFSRNTNHTKLYCSLLITSVSKVDSNHDI